MSSRASFTLIELLVVIAIVAVLATAVVTILNPSQLIKSSRDSTRLQDITNINSAINLLNGDNPSLSFGTTSVIYISIPDTSPICANLGLPTPPSGWSYACVTTSTLTKVDGTGWIPLNFISFSAGSILPRLPIDPVNTTSSNLYYTYISGSWHLSAELESDKYKSSYASQDKGIDSTRFETGSNLSCGGIITDYEGNIYSTVQIGTQCWMGSHLKTKYKPDGSCINGGSSPCSDASSADNGLGRCCYNNTESICQSDGSLYTWIGVMNGSATEGARGICPEGWHVPTDAEQNTLDQYLTDSGQTCNASRYDTYSCATAGTKMKVGGTSGFNSVLTGYRGMNGAAFGNRSVYAYLWSSSIYSGTSSIARIIYSSSDSVSRRSYFWIYSFPLRCLKD